MNGLMRGVRGAAVLSLVLAATGCSQLGTVGDILGGVLQPGAGSGSASEVYGTVRYVDTRNQTIQIQTQNGQVGNVYFDQRTQVVYQNQQYPVTALEQGDQVGMRLQQTQNGQLYTNYIMVTQSVQQSGGVGSNTGGYGLQQLDGRVSWVDYSRGQFGLQTNRGTVTVALRYNTSAADADRFRRLRQGDYVRVEGQMTGQSTFELDRFF